MSRPGGTGAWDIIVHVVVTVSVAVFAYSYFAGSYPDEQILPVVIGGSALLLGLRLRRERPRLGGQGAGDHDVLEELEARVSALELRSPVTGETDLVAQRLLELEERVDFAERLLTQSRQDSREGDPATPDAAR